MLEHEAYMQQVSMMKNAYGGNAVGYSQQIKTPPSTGLINVEEFNSKVKYAVLSKLETLVNSEEWKVVESGGSEVLVKYGNFEISSGVTQSAVYYNDKFVEEFTEQQANDLHPTANIVRKILLDAMDRHIKEIEQGV